MKLLDREIKFIDFHTHGETVSPETLSVISFELADFKKSPPIPAADKFFSVGLHPWRLPATTAGLEKVLPALRQALASPGVIALGEAGLDRLRGPDMTIQTAFFTAVLKLAAELNKTMIVHCVRAYPELLALKKQFADVKMLVHGYNGKVDILEQLLRHDCFVSFGAAALRRDDLYTYVRQKPACLSRICLETDDSDINIRDVYNTAAQVFGLEPEELVRIMKMNFIALW